VTAVAGVEGSLAAGSGGKGGSVGIGVCATTPAAIRMARAVARRTRVPRFRPFRIVLFPLSCVEIVS
jgi:hypothetical protein